MSQDPFLKLLAEELEKRQRANPRYSFRAFAYQLKIDASTLHHIMNGRRNAGPKRRRQILLALGFAIDQVTDLLQTKSRD